MFDKAQSFKVKCFKLNFCSRSKNCWSELDTTELDSISSHLTKFSAECAGVSLVPITMLISNMRMI